MVRVGRWFAGRTCGWGLSEVLTGIWKSVYFEADEMPDRKVWGLDLRLMERARAARKMYSEQGVAELPVLKAARMKDH